MDSMTELLDADVGITLDMEWLVLELWGWVWVAIVWCAVIMVGLMIVGLVNGFVRAIAPLWQCGAIKSEAAMAMIGASRYLEEAGWVVCAWMLVGVGLSGWPLEQRLIVAGISVAICMHVRHRRAIRLKEVMSLDLDAKDR